MTQPAIKVQDYMSDTRPSVTCGTPVAEVVHLFLKHKLLGCPVVDADKKVIGFVSEQDCIKSTLQGSYYCDLRSRVNDVMHSAPLCVKPDDDILHLAEMMMGAKPKIYPVVDDEGVLIGTITRADILQALVDSFENCRQVI